MLLCVVWCCVVVCCDCGVVTLRCCDLLWCVGDVLLRRGVLSCVGVCCCVVVVSCCVV